MDILQVDEHTAYARDVAKLKGLVHAARARDVTHDLEESLITFDRRYSDTPTADLVLFEGLKALPAMKNLWADKVLKESKNPARAALLAERLAEQPDCLATTRSVYLYRAAMCARKAGNTEQQERVVGLALEAAKEAGGHGDDCRQNYVTCLKLGDEADAAEARQRVFLTTYNLLQSTRNISKVSPWLNLALWQPSKPHHAQSALKAEEAEALSTACFDLALNNKQGDVFDNISLLSWSVNAAQFSKKPELVGRGLRALETIALQKDTLYGTPDMGHRHEALRQMFMEDGIELKVNSKNLALAIYELAATPGLEPHYVTDFLGFVAHGCKKNPAMQRVATERALELALQPTTDSLDRKGLLNLVIDCPAAAPTSVLRAKQYLDAADGQTEAFNALAKVSLGFVKAVSPAPAKPVRRKTKRESTGGAPMA